MKNAAFQKIFQPGERVKLVSLMTIYSQFTIYRHCGRNLLYYIYFFYVHENIGRFLSASVSSLTLFVCATSAALSRTKTWQATFLYTTLHAALAKDSAVSASSCWMQGPCISSQCFFNYLATTLLFMGRMCRDKKCIVCL